MKQLRRFTFAACLAALVASAGSGVAIPAESADATQELQNALASDQVRFARWTRQADAYLLQVGLRRAQVPIPTNRARPDPAPVAGAEAPPRFTLPAPAGPTEVGAPDRGSFFIGNTIANLRGIDPVFCGRTLTLQDGRRTLSGERRAVPPPPDSRPTNLPDPITAKDSRVEVWLLKADGTHIPPTAYGCDPGSPSEAPADRVFVISYTYPPTEGELAVAAAIRVRDEFFIEKLQPLQPPVEVQ